MDCIWTTLWTPIAFHLLRRLARFANVPVRRGWVALNLTSTLFVLIAMGLIVTLRLIALNVLPFLTWLCDYVSHKFSLKEKLLAKRGLKAPLPPSMVVPDPAVVAGDPPPAKPALPSASPALVTSAFDSSVAVNQSSVESKYC